MKQGLFQLSIAFLINVFGLQLGFAQQKPLDPATAAKSFEIPEDLAIDQVLSDPLIAQPVYISFDDRGRMWVVEYRQYPHPAGLKILSRDRFWRNVYDKVPAAPPNHVKGADKITIHEDSNGDGKYDSHKTFIDGLNICTSVVFGRGGAWVLNPPYLQFYPDKNRDDVPDGDPQLILAGFGMEDTHSVANSLHWGPDGWLYAAQGSTVTAKLINHGASQKDSINTMGQLIWRYHPERKIYEVFAEGGGNAFGVEIDNKGRIYSGHNGGNTRGFHYVQGGYLRKGFEKHGSLSNPFAYGYFPQMKHENVQRFTHNFIIYDGDQLPIQYHGKLFGVEPLQGRVVQSAISKRGATFSTTDINRVIKTKDKWFKPVDIKHGPDGAIYVCDWYDFQVSHTENYQGRMDNTNGRIYRLRSKEKELTPPKKLSNLTSVNLVEHLQSPNRWTRRTVLQILRDRHVLGSEKHAEELLTKLKMLFNKNASEQIGLEYLWAIHLLDQLGDGTFVRAAESKDPNVRTWAIQLACNFGSPTKKQLNKIEEMCAAESNHEVLCQLASSLRRLPLSMMQNSLFALIENHSELEDPYIPLAVWWALESKLDSIEVPCHLLNTRNGRALTMKKTQGTKSTQGETASDSLPCDQMVDAIIQRRQKLYGNAFFQAHLAERIAKRMAATGTQGDFQRLSRLIRSANKHPLVAKTYIRGFEVATKGESLAKIPTELLDAIAKAGGGSFVLDLRQGKSDGIAKALEILNDNKADSNKRIEIIEAFATVNRKECIAPLLVLIKQEKDPSLLAAALVTLRSYESESIGKTITEQLARFDKQTSESAILLLTSRQNWAATLISKVQKEKELQGKLTRTDLQKILLFDNELLTTKVKRIFGDSVAAVSSSEIKSRINKYFEQISEGKASPYDGKKIFTEQCAKCHRLFDEGRTVGPDLSSYPRADLKSMLLHIVNPSAEIREGYENYLVETFDGRSLSGYKFDENRSSVVIRGADGRDVQIQKDDIENIEALPQSIMPEGILKSLTEKQRCDLFAYLRSTQPLAN